jgi:DNA-binding NarL/FixJ family response regulator
MQERCPDGGATRVVLVDEEHLIRAALAQVLRAHGLEVVGEASTGEEAVEVVVSTSPDVVLIDPALPGASGSTVIGRLHDLARASRILVLTRSWQDNVVEAMLAGACGYMVKSSPTEAIVAAVKATAADECVLSPIVAGELVRHVRERDTLTSATSESAAAGIRAALTTRELEVLSCLASGKSNRDIGRELLLSPSTASNHIASILSKLDLENRVQAAVHSVRSGVC